MDFGKFDVVRVLRDFGEYGIMAGSIGTIVLIYEEPQKAYHVEFTDESGRTIAEFPISASDLEIVHDL